MGYIEYGGGTQSIRWVRRMVEGVLKRILDGEHWIPEEIQVTV